MLPVPRRVGLRERFPSPIWWGLPLLVRIDEDDSIAVPMDLRRRRRSCSGNLPTAIGHIVDDSDHVVTQPPRSAISSPRSMTIKVTVAAAPHRRRASSRRVVIDDASQDSLKFTAKTTTSTDTDVPVGDVPPGARIVLAAVEGYAPKFELKTFI